MSNPNQSTIATLLSNSRPFLVHSLLILVVAIAVAFWLYTELSEPKVSPQLNKDYAIAIVKSTRAESLDFWPWSFRNKSGKSWRLDELLKSYVQRSQGPLRVYGWEAKEFDGVYLISFSFDEGHGKEGYFFEVQAPGIVRPVNWDSSLAVVYGLCESQQPFWMEQSWRAPFDQPNNEPLEPWLWEGKFGPVDNRLTREELIAELAVRCPVRVCKQ